MADRTTPEQQARLAAALRANLARRKTQQRGRPAGTEPGAGGPAPVAQTPPTWPHDDLDYRSRGDPDEHAPDHAQAAPDGEAPQGRPASPDRPAPVLAGRDAGKPQAG